MPDSEIPKRKRCCIEWIPILSRRCMQPLAATWRAQLSIGNPIRASASSLPPTGIRAKCERGDVITGIDAAEARGAVVFQAGTRRTGDGLATSGGRVLGVTASGLDLRSAIHATYDAARHIHFDGMHYRSDIGAKGLKRY